MTLSISIPAMLLFAGKASLVFAVAFGFTALLRRASASSRHLVWLAAFCGALILPAAALLAPALSIPVPEWLALPVTAEVAEVPAAFRQDRAVAEVRARVAETAKVAAAIDALRADQSLAAALEVPAPSVYVIEVPAPTVFEETPVRADASMSWPWTVRIFMLWVAGFVMVGIAFAVGVLRTHLVACAALPADDRLAEEVEILSASMGIVRDVRVVTWPGPAMPMTWGARQPVVLLPHDAHGWPAARRREVLTHELAHVRRGDWLVRLLAAFVCALHWFNPVVWMAARRLRDEQELACDDAVLDSGVRPSDYAAHLLEVARSLRTPAGVAHAAVAMARPSQLADRLLAVLDTSRSRRATPRGLLIAGLMAVLVAIPLGALVPASPAPAQSPKRAPRAPKGPPPASAFKVAAAPSADVVIAGVASTAAPAGAVASAVAVSMDCRNQDARRGSRGNSTTHSSSSSDDGSPRRTTLSLRRGNCFVEVKFVGNVTFKDDESDVENVPRDASVRVTEEGDGPDKVFTMQWRSGRLERRFQVDGETVPESNELLAWLAATLQTTLTGTGYNAVPRAMRAYRAGGLDSTLRLTEAMESDYTKRVMLMALIDSVRIPAAEAARVARQARSMSSDYEKAELLIAVATRIRLDASVQEAMAASTGEMSSDYERRRVLSAALARDGISARAAADLLATAERMSSDYEKAELLLGYLRRQALDEDRRASFFRSVGSMSSDYERGRVLKAVVGRSETPAVVGSVAEEAARMSSDYEKAELLIAMARQYRTDDARAQIRRAAETMSSEYERDRVYRVVGRVLRF